MAIIKHISYRESPIEKICYLIRSDDPDNINYIVSGHNCTPYNIASHYFLDAIHHTGKVPKDGLSYHHYIISYDPRDRRMGLTAKKAHQQGQRITERYFCGFRVLIVTHEDGTNGSGNIHVHIIIIAVRVLDQDPDPRYMPLDSDGTVLPRAYKAGYKHCHNDRLWKCMMNDLQEYCHENGYTVTPISSARRVNQYEYLAQQRGQRQLDEDNAVRAACGIPVTKEHYLTQKEELRHAIADATAHSADWHGFVSRLRTHYTRSVEHGTYVPLIPLPEQQRMKAAILDIDLDYMDIHTRLLEGYKEDRAKCQRWLSKCYEELKQAFDHQAQYHGVPNRQVRETQESVDLAKTMLQEATERLKTLELSGKVYVTYSKAASIALSRHMGKEAAECIDQMEEWLRRQTGYWIDPWRSSSDSYFLSEGKLLRRLSWAQTTDADVRKAEQTLRHIQATALSIEMDFNSTYYVYEQFVVDVKIDRDHIYYKHPDYPHWISGYALGDDYTLESLQKQIQAAPTPAPCKVIEAER